jgi:ribosomal silencing factor RsfS
MMNYGLHLVSVGSKINDSPGHFMVLQAIARGLDTIDKIATATRKSKDEVRAIIDDLVNQRLANMKEKWRFFGSKETKYTMTETGSSLLGVKQQELRQSQERLQQMYDGRDRQQLQGYMDSNRAWIPFMLMSGIIDALFFVSILSFMGMAMSPSEQPFVDSSSTDGAAGGDAASDSDTSGTDSTPGSDLSGTGDTGGGDVGFDGGGFDF